MLYLMKFMDEQFLYPMRYSYLVNYLSPYLKDSMKVLDVGASCGRLANRLSKKLPETRFMGVDPYVQPKSFIPVKQSNGTQIPYPDNSFDCVMIIDVLHHDKNSLNILKEARRVSKKYVLIKDHFWKNKFDFYMLKMTDYLINKPYGIPLPYNFFTLSDWKDLIEQSNLKIIKSQRFRYNLLNTSKHVIYLLEKK